MTYEEAKLHSQELNRICDIYSNKMDSFETNEMGLVSNEVRNSEEYKIANMNFKKSFAELQKFNIYFTKTFKKEYLKERDEKRRKLQRA